MTMKRPVFHRITHASMKPYGWVIDAACVKDDGKKNCFGILFKEKAKGWRIGYLIARERRIWRVEYHDSRETFEPVSGKAVIALATHAHPERLKFFLLDKPICLAKGVWHDVAALSKCCEIKIVENSEVGGEYHYLAKPIPV